MCDENDVNWRFFRNHLILGKFIVRFHSEPSSGGIEQNDSADTGPPLFVGQLQLGSAAFLDQAADHWYGQRFAEALLPDNEAATAFVIAAAVAFASHKNVAAAAHPRT